MDQMSKSEHMEQIISRGGNYVMPHGDLCTCQGCHDRRSERQSGGRDSALDRQVGGDHYKTQAIQPVVYNHANKLPFIEGNIVKYITRWKEKGGIQDLEKVKHYVEMLIELEGK